MWTAVWMKPGQTVPPPPLDARFMVIGNKVSTAICSWSNELRRYELEGGKWVRVDEPMTAELWDEVLSAVPGTPFHDVLHSIPPKVLWYGERAGGWKHTAVELMAQSPYAIQLAEQHPNLFWLACGAWNRNAPWSKGIRDIAVFQLKRPNLAKWALGRAVDPALLDILARFKLNKRNRTEYAMVLWIMNHEDRVRFLGHLPEVNMVAMKQLRTTDAAYMTSLLLKILSSVDKGVKYQLGHYNQVMAGVVEQLDDLGISPVIARKLLEECTTMGKLEELRSDMMNNPQAGYAVTCPKCVGVGGVADCPCFYCKTKGFVILKGPPIVFPKPPIKDTDTIVFIGDSYALHAEGKELHHCVGGYTNEAAAGEFAFFKVLAPERATVQVSFDSKGQGTMQQLKGYCNAAVGLPTHNAIRSWLFLGACAHSVAQAASCGAPRRSSALVEGPRA